MSGRDSSSDGLGQAIALLTVLPVRRDAHARPNPAVAAWFPWVGIAFGVVGYAIVKLAGLAHVETRAPYVVATVVVIAWALLSRMMHWDALADVADGYWGSEDVSRRLEILSDSRTGAFGATAVTLIALLEVAAIGRIVGAPHEFVILLVPVLSRSAATAAAWFGHPAREGGLGRTVIGRPGPVSVVTALLPVVGASAALSTVYGLQGVIPAACAVLLACAIPYALAKRFGGVTGDVMGASVLLVEAGTLTSFVAIAEAVVA